MREQWTPNLEDENEPRVNLRLQGNETLGHRGNLRLYTFLGKLAVYDHVFYTGQEDNSCYIFSFVEGYEELRDHMLEENYPAYLNQTEVAQVDLDAYDRIIQRIAAFDELPPDMVA